MVLTHLADAKVVTKMIHAQMACVVTLQLTLKTISSFSKHHANKEEQAKQHKDY